MNRSNLNLQIAACLGIALLMLCPAASAQTTAAGSDSPAADLFKTNCAICHGDNGAGTELGKRLHSADLRSAKVRQMTPSEMAAIVKSGKNNMPSFASKLTDDEVEQVVKYVRQFRAGPKQAAK